MHSKRPTRVSQPTTQTPAATLKKRKPCSPSIGLLEARDVLDVTERLLKSALANIDSDLRTAYHSSDRELYSALRRKYEAPLNFLSTSVRQ